MKYGYYFSCPRCGDQYMFSDLICDNCESVGLTHTGSAFGSVDCTVCGRTSKISCNCGCKMGKPNIGFRAPPPDPEKIKSNAIEAGGIAALASVPATFMHNSLWTVFFGGESWGYITTAVIWGVVAAIAVVLNES